MTFSFSHGYTDQDGLTASQRSEQRARRLRSASNARINRAVQKYTALGCIRAAYLNDALGEGAASIALTYSIPNVTSTQAADAAINAGRHIRRMAITTTQGAAWLEQMVAGKLDTARRAQLSHWLANIK